jgi:hypothetical protein
MFGSDVDERLVKHKLNGLHPKLVGMVNAACGFGEMCTGCEAVPTHSTPNKLFTA